MEVDRLIWIRIVSKGIDSTINDLDLSPRSHGADGANLPRGQELDRQVRIVVRLELFRCFKTEAATGQVVTTISGELQVQRPVDAAKSNPAGDGVVCAVIYFAANYGI
jgi:hypothetical protein